LKVESVKAKGESKVASCKGKGAERVRAEKFEDLIAWQKARELTRRVYRMTASEAFSKDFGLRDQIRRAAVSIMSNLAEGFERGSTAEYHQFIVVAKGSCGEVRSQLYVAFDADYISQADFNSLCGQAVEVSKIINGLKSSIKNNSRKAKTES
jgi:four helix bundle protein